MKVNHLAIAVRDIAVSSEQWSKLLNLSIPEIHILEDRGVKACTFDTDNLRIELVQPLNEDSPIAKFINERGGGLHHIALETDDIESEIVRNKADGLRFIGDKPVQGLDDTSVIFVHPKSMGVLIELVQPLR